MSNPGMRLTKAGKRILAQGLLGEEIHFTKIAFGDADFDYETEDLRELTELKSWKLDLPIIDRTLNGDGTVTIVGLCTNFKLTKGFRAKEIGIFATDPETKAEVLYAYRNAGDEYSYIPAKTGVVTKSVRYAYQIEIGDAENVTFEINFSFSYVSREDFEKHVESENPHPQFVEAQKQARENRQILNALAEMPFETNLLVFEDFYEPSYTDDFKVKVTNSVVGANLITVTSIANFKLGYYYISDGEKYERLKITSVMKVESGLHVKAETDLTQDYDLTKTYLYRTTQGQEVSELFLKKESSEIELRECAVIVRHSELIDTELTATAFLYDEPQVREDIFLGKGEGSEQVYVISDAGIDQDSLEVRVDGAVVTNYYFETGNAYVKLTAPSDSSITASWTFENEPLEIPLTELDTFKDGEVYVTRFIGASEVLRKKAAVALRVTKLAPLLPEEEVKIYQLAAGFGI